MNHKQIEERVNAGVHFLVWVAVYGLAAFVVAMDLFVWRPF
jgi:hypothetical protein